MCTHQHRDPDEKNLKKKIEVFSSYDRRFHQTRIREDDKMLFRDFFHLRKNIITSNGFLTRVTRFPQKNISKHDYSFPNYARILFNEIFFLYPIENPNQTRRYTFSSNIHGMVHLPLSPPDASPQKHFLGTKRLKNPLYLAALSSTKYLLTSKDTPNPSNRELSAFR